VRSDVLALADRDAAQLRRLGGRNPVDNSVLSLFHAVLSLVHM
jgi:hypothetical protein